MTAAQIDHVVATLWRCRAAMRGEWHKLLEPEAARFWRLAARAANVPSLCEDGRMNRQEIVGILQDKEEEISV